MKNLIFALIALIGFSFISCGQNDSRDVAMADVSDEIVIVKNDNYSNEANFKDYEKVSKNELGVYSRKLAPRIKKEIGMFLPRGMYINRNSNRLVLFVVLPGNKFNQVSYNIETDTLTYKSTTREIVDAM